MGAIYRTVGLIPLKLASQVAALFDQYIIDGLVDGLASLVRRIGQSLRNLQRGPVQESLALAMVVSVVVIVTLLLVY